MQFCISELDWLDFEISAWFGFEDFKIRDGLHSDVEFNLNILLENFKNLVPRT